MARIFVSYATADVNMVEATIAHAEAMAPDLIFFRASDPDSLMPGVKWRERILQEMDRTDLAVFFISSDSMERPWLNFELGYVEKSAGISMICVTINQPDLSKSNGPMIAHQLVPLSTVPKLAGEGLLRFIRNHIPAENAKSRRNTIQIAAKIVPLERGWQRYVHSGRSKTEIHKSVFGVSFGKTFDDDGFRYPASLDTLQAPWEFLAISANPEFPVNIYFVTEMGDGSLIKLYVNSKQDTIGFGVPNDEFQIPVPTNNRPHMLLVNTRSFVPRLGREPVAIRGLRVRGPTELANIGMFETRASVPARFKRKIMEIALP